jgi:hypothetical protein
LNYGGYFINDHQIATASVTLERQWENMCLSYCLS